MDSNRIFQGFRALGYVSNHLPLIIRYIQRRKEHLIVTAVGRAFHTYGSDHLQLLSVSDAHSGDIEVMTADAYLVFTSSENVIYAWRRGAELQHTYVGHAAPVNLMMPFGPHLISVDTENELKVWDIKSESLFLELQFDLESFKISAILHPSTYLNKILLASEQSGMQLWNLKTSQLIYTFRGWDSPVKVLEQAPAIDVVAVGLASGAIVIHNLKFDETLMKFLQEWGPVTALSFRTDGQPFLASASPAGHVAIWNLENKQLHSQIREAHDGTVTGLKYLTSEPLLVTSSSDNSLKMWIFDQSDGSGRLLRFRDGHSAPPIRIRYYGFNGNNILSAGLDCNLKVFSTVGDNLNKNLGRASYNRKVTKKKGLKNDLCKMPPIVDLASEATREKEWDNIAACHRNLCMVTSWSFEKCSMGQHKFIHQRFKGQTGVIATCLTITSCGNFVLIGYNTGHVDKYNIQSGILRGTYGEEKAHDTAVRGVQVDGLSQLTMTGGSDSSVKFWRFKGGTLLMEVTLESSVALLLLHRESGMLAVAMDNFTVVVLDQETRKIARVFQSHGSRITDMAFSSDARWLITSSIDKAIRTWDLPTGRLIDCFLVPSPCTSLTVSPTGDFLATTHTDDLGIYLWSNTTLYSHVSLNPLPDNFRPQLVSMPLAQLSKVTTNGDASLQEETLEFKSPEQISDELVTLSLLPHSQWRSLLNLDIIRSRNKLKEPVKSPKAAPFFLPTVSGLEPQFSKDANEGNQEIKSRITLAHLQPLSPIAELLQSCSDGDYLPFLSKFNTLGPAAIDVEIRTLAPDMGGSVELMLYFLQAVHQGLKTNRDFELMQAYLALFLKIHGDVVSSQKELHDFMEILKVSQLEAWQKLEAKFNQSLCLVNYLRNTVL